MKTVQFYREQAAPLTRIAAQTSNHETNVELRVGRIAEAEPAF